MASNWYFWFFLLHLHNLVCAICLWCAYEMRVLCLCSVPQVGLVFVSHRPNGRGCQVQLPQLQIQPGFPQHGPLHHHQQQKLRQENRYFSHSHVQVWSSQICNWNTHWVICNGGGSPSWCITHEPGCNCRVIVEFLPQHAAHGRTHSCLWTGLWFFKKRSFKVLQWPGETPS